MALEIPHEIDTNLAGVVSPTQPSSPLSPFSASEEVQAFFRTLPVSSFKQPPSPPSTGQRYRGDGMIDDNVLHMAGEGAENGLPSDHLQRPQHLQPYHLTFCQPEGHLSFSAASYQVSEFSQPRKPLTSIAGSSRCLWPPDSTFLTMTDEFKERILQHPNLGSESTMDSPPKATTLKSQKNPRSDSFKDNGDGFQELQQRRKARRVVDGPYFKGVNHDAVGSHVRKLIQEAVEDGVGELDLSNLELEDLPSDIRDLNFAIVYSERGSLSLSKNQLKLFLSSNHFTTIPMDVFALTNLSVLSIRNNNIEVIPPEIGLLVNLVELSVGGNLLRVLPSQVALLPKLSILTVHPNPFLVPSEPEANGNPTNQDEIDLFQDVHGADNTGLLPLIPGQSQMVSTGVYNPPQHSTLFISPSTSPLIQDDIEMTTSILGHDGIDVGSLSFTTQGSTSFDADTMDGRMLGLYSSQGSSSSSSSSPSSVATATVISEAEAAVSRNVGAPVSGYDLSGSLPPHKVTRSRFPTLLTLAGNALLNYMDTQEVSVTTATRADIETQDQPWMDCSGPLDKEERSGGTHESESRGDYEHNSWHSSNGPDHNSHPKRKSMFKEEKIRAYLTPYLFDTFKRAWTNNRCAGCQRRFWKSCRKTVLWQDLLGQTKVPIEWQGCGIGGCSGMPESVWPPRERLLSSLATPSESSPEALTPMRSGLGSSTHSYS